MFIADSESSTVRKVALAENGEVKNVCGSSRDPTDLFAFGDCDGKGVDAKLKHPLGVAYSEAGGCLYVADSYNHKIKRVTELASKSPVCQSLPLPAGCLKEPGGLALSVGAGKNGRLFIADTNHSQIKVVTGLLNDELECQCSSLFSIFRKVSSTSCCSSKRSFVPRTL